MTATPGCTLTATLHARPEKRAKALNCSKALSLDLRASPAASNIISTSATRTRTSSTYENSTDRAALDVHLNLPYQEEWFGRMTSF